ncbi:M20/M25/M40 family metallo-hydrolase [Gelidibacter sp.]|uniref:M20/M25/M40 family metallo-hydrolase n=1 Tax=Gelidibacter sp. TaxID=2018083 RepID=UPI002C488D91|nr:M20/M25/M40 family metallo-hydrolase [Gelidibacter sp.]HUH28576.1 M20/M25/M40 family metallo-hydrolase [Gelidibacter sp.]
MKSIYKYSIISVFFVSVACKSDFNPEITVEDLTKTVTYLASDELEGRLPGSQGGVLAGNYIAERFKLIGVKPAGESGYFQNFNVVTETEAPLEENFLKIGNHTAELHKDFIPFSYSSNVSLEAQVAMVGYGFDISEDSLQWNDYENVNVRDKWVLLLRNDPEIRDPNSLFIPFSGEKSKVLTAKEKGAKGVLLVAGENVSKKDKLLDLEIDQTESNLGIPAFNITRELANKILESVGKTIEEVESGLVNEMKPNSFVSEALVEAQSKIVFKTTETRNVIGIIEGSDSNLKSEYVVVGAHYDHLGWGGSTTSSREPDVHAIHYGADDNASGVSGMLEIAEKLVNSSLKRSVILIGFGAEEIGIIGSKYFTMNPTIPKDKIVAMVNLDMIGRLKDTKEITVSGVGTSIEGEQLLEKILSKKERDLVLGVEQNGFGPSDHANFYVEDIPVFFFNTGAHDDYHTSGDVLEKIDFDGLRRITEYAYDLSENLVNSDTALTFQEAGPKGKAANTRKGKVALGLMPYFGKSEEDGLRVDGVTKGLAADKGGMKKGDVIVGIAGKKIHNIYEYMDRMTKIRPGQTINVDVMRDGKKEILIIQIDHD